MNKICPACGAVLEENMKFCPACGKKTEETAFCKNCGKPLRPGAKFCSSCGETAANDIQPPSKSEMAPVIPELLKGTAHSIQANPTAGTFSIDLFSPAEDVKESVSEILSPLKTIGSGFRSLISGLKTIWKKPKALIPTLVLGILWIVLMLLDAGGVKSPVVDILSVLTFSRGGSPGSVMGNIGNLLGKTVVASSFVSVFGTGLPSFGRGLKSLFQKDTIQKKTFRTLLLGAGFALILYQLLAWKANVNDIMAGISAAALSVQALGNENSFLFSLARSLTAKKNAQIRTADNGKLTSLLTGASIGFTAGAAVSFVPFAWLSVCIGGGCVLAGFVLGLIFTDQERTVPVT